MFEAKLVDVVDRIVARSEAAGVTELSDNALTFMSLMCLADRIDLQKLVELDTAEFKMDMANIRDTFDHKSGTLNFSGWLYSERQA